MTSFCILMFSLLPRIYAGNEPRIPEDFLLGFATSSYQIEGAWNEDGKGENIWDRFVHTQPERILDGSNGDVAADSYHKYKEDVKLLKNLGAQAYRFSLSWSRILPTGEPDNINQLGVDYYNNLINELCLNGIKPVVTLFHFDHPQPLEDIGGWQNSTMADYFVEYAKVAFKMFGDRVKMWISLNEPSLFCHFGYGIGEFPPSVVSPGVGEYLCGHTMLKAHAKAYHIYDELFRPTQKGKFGITLVAEWYEPLTDSPEDSEAAETGRQFLTGWFANPIFSAEGDYPSVMRERIDANSEAEGRSRSRLPRFNTKEVQYIKGTADFLGANHYSTYLTTTATTPNPNNSFFNNQDMGIQTSQDPSWSTSASGRAVVPFGIGEAVNWIRDTYNNIPVIITENGYSDRGDIEDRDRISYHNDYLRELLNAIKKDRCPVFGYLAWSLLDNFEFTQGYSVRFGIYHVNFDDSNRTRTPKASVDYWKEVISSRALLSI